MSAPQAGRFAGTPFDLTDKVALVTGGSKGLGLSMAMCLAQAGARVALCGRNGAEASAAAASIEERWGAKAQGVAADVTKPSEVAQLAVHTRNTLGPIDILVTSAGINIRKEVSALSIEDWDSLMHTNLRGAFVAAKEMMPSMKERGWGRIVFLGSALSFISMKGRAAYAASKSAILGLTRTLALEGAQHNVLVNALCPGPFKTPMNETLINDPSKGAEIASRIPLGRWGEPSELDGAILLLCSDAGSYMTGSALVVDGGWTAR